MTATSRATGTVGRTAVVFGAAGLVVGAVVGGAAVFGAGLLLDDSRSRITIRDVTRAELDGLERAAAPSREACGDRRGCVEGVDGPGASIHRYHSLDLARQATVYNTTDVYRSDRLVIEFEPHLGPAERHDLIQVIEGTWTGSSD
ncbi:hypothetical protein C5C36_09325 [Rathayibacter sp. AY1G1]|uniref:hypothetical protein n=1 Tax=unclassified Rathayibacter TaxID=2609250 RepID=UPI000CE935CA|nr:MULTISPECIES: hypothetical protein [unclassified Rathayibacter]PPG40918.1 hypothetical protein C5C30_08910 [Rathayibacter sp. AY2B5]PPH12511.1 hypothetical protein C5C36_09325 [Rathayibacter sp. AY1G1]PPH28742.1 hypothetical protein C5C37_09395 [Rathayibacter sp. AY1F9]